MVGQLGGVRAPLAEEARQRDGAARELGAREVEDGERRARADERVDERESSRGAQPVVGHAKVDEARRGGAERGAERSHLG